VEKNAWLFNKDRNAWVFGIIFIFVSVSVLAAYFLLSESEKRIDLSVYGLDSAELEHSLNQSGIEFRFENNKETLLIQKDNENSVLSLLEEQSNNHDRVGFEVFDAQEYGVSDFKQKISLIRALQGELEKTILTMDGVLDARVHLVINNKRFRTNDNTGKASIYLKLSNTDDNSGLKGKVVDLVKYSVPSVTEENIKVITNETKKLLTLEDYPLMHHKVKVEEYYKDKLIEVLSILYSVDRFVVNVDISVSADEYQSQSEKVIPSNGDQIAVSKKERINETSKGKGTALEKNVSKDIEHKFRTGTTIENITRSPFMILSKNIGVLLLDKISNEEIEDLEQLISVTAGVNTTSGDRLIVKSIHR
jgi:flagellar M-ring protein FliF